MTPEERLQMIREVRIDLSGAKPTIVKKNFEPLEKGPDDPCWENYVQVGTKIVDGREVPNCVPLEASKVVKEGFPIPSPSGNEDEQTYVSRCIKAIYDEYDDVAQAAAICYAKYRE